MEYLTSSVRFQVFFKMDRNGEGQEISVCDLPSNREVSLVGFTPTMFLEVRDRGPVRSMFCLSRINIAMFPCSVGLK